MYFLTKLADSSKIINDQPFISLLDINEQPTDIVLSNTNITENSGTGELVGLLTTNDPDASQSFTYSMLDSAAGLFRAIGNRVEVSTSNRICLLLGGNNCQLNYEKQKSMDIRVKSQDNGSPPLSTEKVLTITLMDINDKPRDIILSANSVKENATLGYLIGQLSATDEDSGQSLTFRLTDDDSGRFQINQNNFVIKAKDTNYETQKTHKITVEVSDNGNPVLKVMINLGSHR